MVTCERNATISQSGYQLGDARSVRDDRWESVPIVDDRGRNVRLEATTGLRGRDVDQLVEMYETFDTAQRTLAIPPLAPDDIREWVESLRQGHHVVARHDGHVVGHAVLVPTASPTVELAIVVHQAYQHVHIGTRMLQLLLQYAEANDVTTVRLDVERTNERAIALYRNLGFHVEHTGSSEVEMTTELAGGRPSAEKT